MKKRIPIRENPSLCLAVWRIQHVYPGSRIRNFSIPDPSSRVTNILDPGSGSASKNLSILNPKNSENGMPFPDPDPDFFFHPGSRGQKSTGSRIPDPQHWLSGIPGEGLHVLEDSETGPEQRVVGGPEVARLQGH
jgi:hypothetical protein